MDENLKGYLLDTNILIYHLKGDIPEREIEKLDSILRRSFLISVITKVEFLGWRKHTVDGFLKAQEFLRHAAIIPVDSELADLAIELRRNSNIKLADALIAATALLNDLVLVTGNEDDFKALEELEIYNPLIKRL
jgi:predicted nucleic acid-binding protein